MHLLIKYCLKAIQTCCTWFDVVMSHPIGAVPSSMFHEDGTMRKNAKSELTSVLENHAASVYDISVVPSETVYIRDAMALIQIIDGNQHTTFDDLGKFYAKLLLQHFNNADTVIEVFDKYVQHQTLNKSRWTCSKSWTWCQQKNIQCSWRASSATMGKILGSFR